MTDARVLNAITAIGKISEAALNLVNDIGLLMEDVMEGQEKKSTISTHYISVKIKGQYYREFHFHIDDKDSGSKALEEAIVYSHEIEAANPGSRATLKILEVEM